MKSKIRMIFDVATMLLVLFLLLTGVLAGVVACVSWNNDIALKSILLITLANAFAKLWSSSDLHKKI